MQANFHKNFKKKYRRRSAKEQRKFDERLKIFIRDTFNPILNNHPLRGDRDGEWSIDITGDIRAIYYFTDDDVTLFIDIDTHSNLYK